MLHGDRLIEQVYIMMFALNIFQHFCNCIVIPFLNMKFDIDSLFFLKILYGVFNVVKRRFIK